MFDALYIGATGMRASQADVDAIAHNVANVNTTAFRRNVVSFEEVSRAVSPTGADPALAPASTDLSARGAGTLATLALSTNQGELKQTGQTLDVAIDGAGFLEVLRPDGTPAYTRAGALRLNSDGMLTLADGSVLAGHLALPPDATQIAIAADGTVTALVGQDSQLQEIGHIDLVTFANPGGLQSVGGNLFVATSDSGAARAGAPGADGRGELRQGFLESSNVQLIDELVTMMVAQRAFELNGRVIQAADQMMAITNGLYRSS
jgi:flagellar basal-body rod protein FlgG